MQCPKCSAAILADDVNLDNLVAKCRRCDAVFSFADGLGELPKLGRNADLPAPRPEKVIVEENSYPRRMSRRWFSVKYLFLVIFCIVWDGFLIFWYSMALQPEAPWIMAVFPIGHLTVGVVLTYYTLAGLLNSTVIELDEQQVVVRHEPLPWAGNLSLDVARIKQLYCEEASGSWMGNARYQNRAYNVNALLLDGKRIKLLSRLEDRGEAVFFEHQLENWMGIKHRPVPGEVR